MRVRVEHALEDKARVGILQVPKRDVWVMAALGAVRRRDGGAERTRCGAGADVRHRSRLRCVQRRAERTLYAAQEERRDLRSHITSLTRREDNVFHRDVHREPWHGRSGRNGATSSLRDGVRLLRRDRNDAAEPLKPRHRLA